MIVSELIKELQKQNPNARVFHAYDGDVVVEESGIVEGIEREEQIGICWWRVQVGDVVILSA
jgi:hypothetical protein